MGYKRRDEWEEDYAAYSENQVESVLEHCGVDIVSQTSTHFLGYCPFHGNTDTPAFAVDKVMGLWTCFNPSCMNAGTLPELVRKTTGSNEFKTQRIILKYRNSSSSFEEKLKKVKEAEPEFVEFSPAAVQRMAAAFKGSVAEEYMRSRGFEDETMEYFEVGYSAKKNMVAVPMHDPKGMLIGVIGRTPSHEDKTFKNSVGLPKAKTAWNFHRAKKTGATVIICEASYDAMRIHQAGYPNVIALLGGSVTDYHINQINRTFSKIILMTDFDKKQFRPNCRPCARAGVNRGPHHVPCVGHRPGRDLGRSIAEKLPNKRVLWAAYDDSCVFPHGAKDASDMTDEEIRTCLRGAVSNLTYSAWNIEEKDDSPIAS